MNASRQGAGGRRRRHRRGAAAIELVIMLPMLCFVSMATADYARLFYAWTTLADCARDGAIFASDPNFATSTTYTTASQAALADATNLSPSPTITQTSGVDASGNSYVQVTASYTFTTLGTYPNIPDTVSLSRSLRMVVTPP